jgi:Ca2+-binding EF-hand superfamily protein/diadenosine tetraphosphatase ApaH/serine/threonine PP2A family protein phosphatase
MAQHSTMAAGYAPGTMPNVEGQIFLVTMNGAAAGSTPVAMPQHAMLAMAVEDADEVKFAQNIGSLGHHQAGSSETKASNLPAGGAFDALLQPGRSKELLRKLSEVFRQNAACQADIYQNTYAQKVFSPAAIDEFIANCTASFDVSPAGNVDHIRIGEGSRMIVVGDTHGQLEDVLWIFFKYGEPSSTNRYLFNGDFADRSHHALEIVLLLLAFKKDIPNSVYVTRGNHEDVDVNVRYGFQAEVLMKSGGEAAGAALFASIVQRVWCKLPFMARLTDEKSNPGIAVVHGGIPKTGAQGPLTFEQLSSINRNFPQLGGRDAPPDAQILYRLLWSDPDFPPAKGPAAGLRGDSFTTQDTELFCQKNNLLCLIRSHQVKPDGWEACHNGKCLTIFSASNYHGSGRNKGAVFLITASATGLGIAVSNFWAPPFSVLCDWRDLSADQRPLAVKHFESKYNVDSPAPPAPGAETETRTASAETAGNAETERVVQESMKSAEHTDNTTEHTGARDMAEFTQFVQERIVECKTRLYDEFKSLDTNESGTVSKDQWYEALSKKFAPSQGIPVETLKGNLWDIWGLKEPVNYIRFLGRFQIAVHATGLGTPPALKEMVMARRALATMDCCQLIRRLDPNGDNQCSMQEFVQNLPLFKVEMDPCHAATVYEEFAKMLKTQLLTVDGMMMCLASTGQDIPPEHEHDGLVQQVCELLRQKGINLAQAFRVWDKSRDGFLSVAEIQSGLQALLAGAARGDASNVADVASVKPPLQLLKYLNTTFEHHDPIERCQPMSDEIAQQTLIKHADRVEGYMFHSNIPNIPHFEERNQDGSSCGLHGHCHRS